MQRIAVPVLVLAVLVGVAAVILLLRDGDGGEPALVAAPPATLVFLRGNDLWVAPLDSSAPPRAITSGSVGAKYAGYAFRPDGGIDLYYLSQLEGSAELHEEVELVVYRVALEGGEPEELFRFPTDNARLSGADVAPDGLQMVYADVDALILRDLATGEETVLARSRRILAGDGSYIRNNMLTSPIWSPTGERVYSTMFGGPDTVVSVVIDTPPLPVTVADLRYVDHWGSWSPGGSQLCLYGPGYMNRSGLTLYDVETHEQIDVLASGALPARVGDIPSSAGSCVWADDGRIAVSYTPNADEPPSIFVLDAELNLISQSEPLVPSGRVIGWLPDGSGVVVACRNPDGESFSAGIFRLGGGIEYLPFEADAVLAVIP